MNMMMGFLESYLEGFDPSRMPPWLAALEAAEVVVGFAVTVAVTTEVMMLAMMARREANHNSPKTKVYEQERQRRWVGRGERLMN